MKRNNPVPLVLSVAAALLAAIACGPKQESTKMLVLYYSQTGGTEAVATEIASRLGADIEKIVAVDPYDGDFQATIERCLQEREAGIQAKIEPVKANLDAYDVIFRGYPIWFGTMAPPAKALVDSVDFAGKKVVPFCTFGSGGLDSSTRDLIALQPDAEVLPGYGVRTARLAAAPKELDRFLKESGFIEGEFTALEAFPEQHPVSETEAALFDAAVAGYPMIHAKASTVASHPHPDGIEYLFTAIDLPREEGLDVPPAHSIQVYVLVEEGQAPVFTQVIR